MKKVDETWGIIDVLTQTRHDWMNKLQLLKGNLALKKYDRAQKIIDQMVIEAQHESKLCQFKMEKFAEFILTYNWLNRFLSIEYVVLGDVLNLSKIDEPLTEWTKQFFSLMENLVEPNAENHLMLTIETVGNRTRFLFDFQGILNKEEELTLFLSTKSYDVIHITVLSCSRSQLTVNLEVTNEHMV